MEDGLCADHSNFEAGTSRALQTSAIKLMKNFGSVLVALCVNSVFFAPVR